MRILIKTPISKNFDEVFKGFDLNLFKALKPPLLKLDVPRFDGCKKGDEVHLKIGFGPISQDWVSHISEHQDSENEHYFIDIGHVLPPPLKSWKHKHRVIKVTDETCIIHDDIEFSSGNKIIDLCLYMPMYFQFWLRKPAYKKFFK